jgi:hypothetical protein
VDEEAEIRGTRIVTETLMHLLKGEEKRRKAGVFTFPQGPSASWMPCECNVEARPGFQRVLQIPSAGTRCFRCFWIWCRRVEAIYRDIGFERHGADWQPNP